MQITDEKLKTYDDYAKLPEGASCQLTGGEIITSPAPDLFHQAVSRNIFLQLSAFIAGKNLGELFYAPIDVLFTEHETYQPDIIFVAAGRKHILKTNYIEGAPDLIVEILSATTGYYDLATKKDVYEAHGVKEYWVVDPKGKTIEIFENVNGRFVSVAKERETGAVTSRLLPELTINVEDVFRA